MTVQPQPAFTAPNFADARLENIEFLSNVLLSYPASESCMSESVKIVPVKVPQNNPLFKRSSEKSSP